MKTIPKNGEVTEFQGKEVSPSIKFSWNADQYETITEIKNSPDWPSDAEILRIVNQKKDNTARQAAHAIATKDLRAIWEASPEFRKQEFIKAAMKLGLTQEEAEKVAVSSIR